MPAWFHIYGELMHPTFNPLFAGNKLRFTTGSTHVTIYKSSRPGLWKVKWTIYRTNPHMLKESEKDKVEGTVTLTTQELYLAFDSVLGSYSKEGTDREFTRRHNLTVGIKGKYVRKGSHLNIPCMGTGDEGDPNASIWLSKEVSVALMSFVTCMATKT
jgi:hypothetical protein